MSTPPEPLADGPLEQALDRALARCLVPPALPQDFRQQLRAAIARSPIADHARLRAALERNTRSSSPNCRAATCACASGPWGA